MKKFLLTVCAFVIVIGGGSYLYKMNQNNKHHSRTSSIYTDKKIIKKQNLGMKSTTTEIIPIVTTDINQLPPWLRQQIPKTGQATQPITSTTPSPNTHYGTNTGNTGNTGIGAGLGNAGTTTTGNTGTDTNTGAPSKTNTGTGTGNNAGSGGMESQILQLVNAERSKAGLQALTLSDPLSKVALTKASDMRDNNYFSHDSPNYGSPFDMMKKFGITYTYAGENIAAGQQTAQDVMTAWMNSEGHRANILNANYSEMGLGYSSGGNMSPYWSQMFIHP